jgi:uncharacterized membrane protein
VRIASVGHAVFAAVLIGLGIQGFVQGDFGAMWAPLPAAFPLRGVVVYACATLLLGSGIGLLLERSRVVTSRVLFGWFALWILVVRWPYLVMKFGVNTWWATAQLSVMTAAAWTLYLWFAGERDAAKFPLITGSRGMRISRGLFGVGLIPFGIAHFMYMNATAPLIPNWIPWHTFFGYATGAAFVAAGLSQIGAVFGRLSAILAAAQIGGFTLIVWAPVIARGNANAGQWREFVTSVTLTAACWVVADGYRSRS